MIERCKKRCNKSKIDIFYKAHIYIQRMCQRSHADEPYVIITFVKPTKRTPATI
jgi:hypothetical protein